MPFRWGEHVGELELRVEAPTERDVFVDATLAFAELLRGEEERTPGASEGRDVFADGQDRAVLFAAYLNELVFLAETEGFVPDVVDRLELDDATVDATVLGHHGTPPHLVKAVTHHALRFEPAPAGWLATAVLDV